MDQRSQARAIHVGEIGEVEHDSLGARNQLADVAVKAVAYSGHEATGATHGNAIAGSLNGDGKRAWGGLLRHPNLPSGRIERGQITAARVYTPQRGMEQAIWVATAGYGIAKCGAAR